MLSPSEEVHEIHLPHPGNNNAELEANKRGERRQLDVKSKEWDGLRRMVKGQMGGMKASTSRPVNTYTCPKSSR